MGDVTLSSRREYDENMETGHIMKTI